MNHFALVLCSLFLLPCAVRAEDAMLERAKLELVVEQAGEMLADANRAGSATHGAAYRYYFGLVYGSGTNLLSRKESPVTRQLRKKYMDLAEKNYEAYTKVEEARGKASATGFDTVRTGRHIVKNGSRHRAKRIVNAEKLGDRELVKAIRQWEAFATQLRRTR